PSITVDDADGGRQAAEHLLELGHRRFAIITDRLSEPFAGAGPRIARPEEAEQTFFVTQRRFAGYRMALEAAGLRWNDVPIAECADNSEADGGRSMRVLLAGGPPPTAVLCVTDRLALGAMAAAQAAGLSVPADLSFVGFDDIPAAATAEPGLTTIRQAHREKGLRAGEALVALLNDPAQVRAQRLPVELVVRGSTGPAPQESAKPGAPARS
ncbi:MAG TPA: substrate-binding domain-containing protein, partial [Herpetosiphonaceae bacterium]|nr:substrate-binding domain-containing protein [Herpetosiphonaceae bacterium]